jgi:hypothetical protein
LERLRHGAELSTLQQLPPFLMSRRTCTRTNPHAFTFTGSVCIENSSGIKVAICAARNRLTMVSALLKFRARTSVTHVLSISCNYVTALKLACKWRDATSPSLNDRRQTNSPVDSPPPFR